MKTYSVKEQDIKKKWVVVDATNQTLGRIATEVASVLRGKNKPTFTPHLDCGDNVIVVNADKVKMSGNKWQDKVYYHHSLYIGGIKAIKAQDLLAKKPERLIEIAVKGMLPKSKLGRKMAKNLRVHAGPTHNQEAQKPVAMSPRIASK